MNLEDYKKSMYFRLDNRLEAFKSCIERAKRYVDNLDGDGGEKDRLWLDQFVKGNGLDICCGDFIVGDVGVDGDRNKVGADYLVSGDELTFQDPESLDYIVTNYLDAFPNPLKALNEWWRCLRKGGVLAIVCRDSDSYKNSLGPLNNAVRQSCYTKSMLSFYLFRSGFSKVVVEATPHGSLRASSTK